MDISWLHISDFHFRASGDMFSQRQVCRALLDSLSSSAAVAQNSLSFIAVTGDLAFSGQKSEYVEAQDFFDKLVATTHLKPSSVFFVPGNHDVNRALHELAYHGGRTHIDSAAKVDYFLAEPTGVSALVDRQEAFWSFVDDFAIGQQRDQTDDGLGYVAVLDIDRPIVCLLGLNSAWLSGSDDEDGRLVIGERQVLNALELIGGLEPNLVLALVHHPVSSLAEWDSAGCNTKLLPAIDLYLRGHLHTHQVSLTSTPASPCLEIAAGAGHASRFYPNSYNITRIDLTTSRCIVQPYQYVHATNQFEMRDSISAPIAIRGEFTGTPVEIASAIGEAVPEAEPYCDFMARLLTDEIGEIPILIAGTVSFVLPSAANAFIGDDLLSSTRQFLGLKNSLRLYSPSVSVMARIADHNHTIAQYARYLDTLVTADPECAPRVRRHARTASVALSLQTDRQWSQTIISDMRQAQEWHELEVFARERIESPDAVLRRIAIAALAESLMHSDETPKRLEASRLAAGLATSADATGSEIVLAAASAEVCGDDRASKALILDALESGRSDTEIVVYAVGLSERTGDSALRRLARKHSHGGQ